MLVPPAADSISSTSHGSTMAAPLILPLRRDPSASRFTVARVGNNKNNEVGEGYEEKLRKFSEPRTPLEEKTKLENWLDLENGNDDEEEEEAEENFKFDSSRLDEILNNTKKSAKAVQFTVGGSIQEEIQNQQQPEQQTDRSNNSYATHSAISFRNMQTVERVPRIDHYRDMYSVSKAIASRPTLAELHEPEDTTVHDEEEKLQSFIPPDQTCSPPTKLGWIKGVLIRCILCILGVMLYLRLSWVAAQAGIGFGCTIVLLGSTVTTLTALSLCAISTNGEVKGGGAYFLISRSLGPEFGGSIGIIFSFANAVAAAMYIVGFAESVRDLMKEYGAKIIDNAINDVRVVGLCTAVILLCVVMVGVQFETKAQLVLLGVLAVSIISFVFGTFLPVSEEKFARGITGYSWSTFKKNWLPDWRGETFFGVFSIYFPAATGIMAGANISGDLADPQMAIPKGTLLAILITTVIYLVGVTLTGSTCVRDASGNVTDSFLLNQSMTLMTTTSNNSPPSCTSSENCPFGLHNYFRIMELESLFSPLVTAGVFAATLSSALASMVSAPKIFQALCKDHLFPYITYFAKGFGNSEEPRPGYLLSFFIATLLICIGDLNSIAPIISNFFLASYALINYACFDASFANSPGFRPGFKFYNMWLSLFGAVICMAVMFLISWSTALITFALMLALYVYLLRRKPEVNWGSSSQAHAYKNALTAMLRLNHIEEHVKNYRPQILALSGNPIDRSLLIDFAANITKDTSLLLCGHVFVRSDPDRLNLLATQKMISQVNAWLRSRRTKAFYLPVNAASLEEGVLQLLQLSGLGKLKPNIMLLGFKQDWRNCTLNEINQYVNMIHYAFDHSLAVGVLRLNQGLEFKRLPTEDSRSQILGHSATENEFTLPLSSHPSFPMTNNIGTPTTMVRDAASGGAQSKQGQGHQGLMMTLTPQTSYNAPAGAVSVTVETGSSGGYYNQQQPYSHSPMVTTESASVGLLTAEPGGNEQPKDYLGQFRKKLKRAVIDVYWLFDDGGLSLLIPHILTLSKSYVEGAKLRVFTIASSRHQLEQEQRSMAALLSKFRIDYADVFVIPDITGKPKSESLKEFETLIRPFLEPHSPPATQNNNNKLMNNILSESELILQKERTNRQIRIRELLQKHSLDATLIVLTMPIPRRNVFSSVLYMAWLETLTRDMPPVLLLRGNQQSVLTFYS